MPGDGPVEKSLPHNSEAERAVLGAILLDNSLYDQAAEFLRAEDFYSEAHRKIFHRMELLSSSGRAIDSVTLREELQKDNALELVGGAVYIASLVDGVPRVSNLEHYARIVKEKSILRRLVHSANDILLQGLSGDTDSVTLLEHAEKSIYDIGQERIKNGFVLLPELLKSTYQHIEALYQRSESVTGVPSGFRDLDQLTSGFQPSDLLILAARPGMGKTSLALNIAQHAAIRAGKTVALFSLEMSAEQLAMRLLCAEARVDSHRTRRGILSSDDWGKLAKAMARLAQARIFIDDTPGISTIEMRSKARRLKAEHGVDLVVVDYLQLMSAPSAGRRGYENRQQEISAISRTLKALAKELHLPVLALSQLSRAPEQRRGDHRPQLSDLRESGSIEQDADVVLFIYREDLYRKGDGDEETGIAELIIGKQRNGPTGMIKLAFITQWTKFEPYSPEVE